jgi:hypothetical protein
MTIWFRPNATRTSPPLRQGSDCGHLADALVGELARTGRPAALFRRSWTRHMPVEGVGTDPEVRRV